MSAVSGNINLPPSPGCATGLPARTQITHQADKWLRNMVLKILLPATAAELPTFQHSFHAYSIHFRPKRRVSNFNN
jgi:hypothetical protein